MKWRLKRVVQNFAWTKWDGIQIGKHILDKLKVVFN